MKTVTISTLSMKKLTLSMSEEFAQSYVTKIPEMPWQTFARFMANVAQMDSCFTFSFLVLGIEFRTCAC
jgi:hypothetical protein